LVTICGVVYHAEEAQLFWFGVSLSTVETGGSDTTGEVKPGSDVSPVPLDRLNAKQLWFELKSGE